MKEFIHSLKFKIIICILALLIGFMIYAATASGAASFPERIMQTITAPFAKASTSISSFVQNNIDKLVNADKYKRENEELRQIISKLNEQNVNIDELKNDNKNLREMLEMSEENPDFQWPDDICTIISWNSGDIFRGFTINRGSDDGVGLYNLVITKIGVVGIITKVAPDYAQVSTILSPETAIGVSSTRTNASGILQSDMIYAEDGLCMMGDIEIDADIKEGDMVVTTGMGLYPSNQMIGEVVEVRVAPSGMSKNAVIKPSEDLKGLTGVLVITNFNEKEELYIIEE